jgi:hypothetical protein
VRYAVAIAFSAVAMLLLAFSANANYGLAAEYGASAPYGGGFGWVLLVLVPAGLALLFLLGARDPVGTPRPRTSLLAVGVLVVFLATGTAAAAYGGSVHREEQLSQASACSVDDVALLAAVDAAGVHSEPAGDPAGGCSTVISGVPDAARAEADVVSALERGGWQRIADEGDEQVFQREDRVLRLSAVSDGKATDVTLTLQQLLWRSAHASAATSDGAPSPRHVTVAVVRAAGRIP